MTRKRDTSKYRHVRRDDERSAAEPEAYEPSPRRSRQRRNAPDDEEALLRQRLREPSYRRHSHEHEDDALYSEDEGQDEEAYYDDDEDYDTDDDEWYEDEAYTYEDDYPPPRPRPQRSYPYRESLMQRRMRVARGEVDEDDLQEDDDESFVYDEPPLRQRPTLARQPAYAAPAGGGCARATLYLVLGGLLALVLTFFFFGRTFDTIGGFFSGLPQIAAPSAPVYTTRVGSAAVMMRIQQLQRLETTSYTIERVIEEEVTQEGFIPFTEGTNRLLLIAHGNVSAGIDLSELGDDQVIVSDDGLTLTVYLPPVEIFDVALDNNETRVYDRENDFWVPTNTELETRARQHGESAILETACEDGIMQRATEDSQRTMQQFLSLLEFQHVEVIPADVPPCTAPDTAPLPPTP
jgi:hypothetical protein